mmetsp:Transcript_45433/g.98907  ORF Transcript_45433/g.98907 Transcript_45433/m.98907 type:complete len:298 (-) Transcript_45433:215-1108(-)
MSLSSASVVFLPCRSMVDATGWSTGEPNGGGTCAALTPIASSLRCGRSTPKCVTTRRGSISVPASETASRRSSEIGRSSADMSTPPPENRSDLDSGSDRRSLVRLLGALWNVGPRLRSGASLCCRKSSRGGAGSPASDTLSERLPLDSTEEEAAILRASGVSSRSIFAAMPSSSSIDVALVSRLSSPSLFMPSSRQVMFSSRRSKVEAAAERSFSLDELRWIWAAFGSEPRCSFHTSKRDLLPPTVWPITSESTALASDGWAGGSASRTLTVGSNGWGTLPRKMYLRLTFGGSAGPQ